MTDVTVTLTDPERWALDAVIVMAIEGRPIPDHWRDYVNALPAVSAKLRAAQPAAPGPLDRLEAWLRANINDCAQFSFFPGQENEWECGVGEPFVRWEGGDAYPDLQGHFANAPTLAAAVDAALKKVQEAQP